MSQQRTNNISMDSSFPLNPESVHRTNQGNYLFNPYRNRYQQETKPSSQNPSFKPNFALSIMIVGIGSEMI